MTTINSNSAQAIQVYVPNNMKNCSHFFPLLALIISVIVSGCGSNSEEASPSLSNPVLRVEAIVPRVSEWPVKVDGEGRITVWQYSIIGSQVGGAILEEIFVEVGDKVAKGQVIAKFNEELITADLLQAQADLEIAKANLEFANRQAESGNRLLGTGALSKEKMLQYKVNKESADASVRSAQARVDLHALRLSWVNVKATDDGVISSRNAVQGNVVSTGEELFRLIRGGRLEWQGKFTEDELSLVKPGLPVKIRVGSSTNIEGRVRNIAPVISDESLMGTIYVDLPLSDRLIAGMYATGSIDIGSLTALHVPESAIVHRDGNEYLANINAENRVSFVKVISRRRHDDRVEVHGEISAGEKIVASGAHFLMEGDLVELSYQPDNLGSAAGEGS